MNEKEIKKFLNSDMVGKIVAIALIVVGAIVIFVGTNYERNNVVTENYSDLIANDKDAEGKYVSVDGAYLPYLFAEETIKGTTNKYYMVVDKDNRWYIARLKDSTFNKLNKEYKKNKSVKYKLEGYIFKQESELINLAVETLHDDLKDTDVTKANFSDYFGKTYLDEEKLPYSDKGYMIEIFGGASALIGLVIFVTVMITSSTSKSTLKSFGKENLINELSKSSTVFFKKYGLCLTDNYVIANANGICVIPYKDIVWMFNEKNTYNGISTGTYLIAKTFVRPYKIAYTIRNTDQLIDIMDQIYARNNNILVGFTKENKEAYKELKKNVNL